GRRARRRQILGPRAGGGDAAGARCLLCRGNYPVGRRGGRRRSRLADLAPARPRRAAPRLAGSHRADRRPRRLPRQIPRQSLDRLARPCRHRHRARRGMMSASPGDFIRANTAIATPPLVPEIRLHLATEITPIWQASEDMLARGNVPPPFWAFPWAGGQALARHVLDHRDIVAGQRVLDFGAGSGLVAIAAAQAGAAAVTAAEIDDFAAVAITLNAALNGVAVVVATADLIGTSGNAWDV